MKTPEEIKKGLDCCQTVVRCDSCTYKDIGNIVAECTAALCGDALAYIQQLESRLAQVERERDAAIVDMHTMAFEDICNLCARLDEGYIPTPPHCKYATTDDECFRWRGPCPENSKEETK